MQWEKLAKILAIAGGDGSQDAPRAGEKIIPVVNNDDEVIHKVVQVRKKVGKSHQNENLYRPSEEDMIASGCAARKARNVCMAATQAGNVYARANLNEVVRDAGTLFKDKSIARDMTASDRSSETQDYLRTRSSQATDDSEAILDSELIVEKPFEPVTDAVGEDVHFVLSTISRRGSRAHTSEIPCLSV